MLGSIPVLPSNLVPASDLGVHRARSWLQTCEQHHSSCRAYQVTYPPQRLLEITQDGLRVRLVHDSGITRYAALTYCWGGTQPYQTTLDKLALYSDRVPIERLHATIKDAIRATYSLGVQYLWVDALCIIQDDSKDLQQQLSQMHRIYRGATITIVAAAAERSTQGFLYNREGWRPSLLRCRIGEGEPFEVSASRHRYNSGEEDVPIYGRGWVLQELRLSTRALLYCTRTMQFFCLESQRDDRGNERDGVRGNWCLNPGCRDFDMTPHPHAWARLIEQYSHLTLGQWTDKLPALGALAATYAERYAVTGYRAGLWAEHFLWQLLWIPSQDYPPRERTPAYTGPTWSWCSLIGGKIEPSRQLPEQYEFTAALKDVRTELLTAINPYGEVVSAQLTLRAKIKPCILREPASSGPTWILDIYTERHSRIGKVLWAALIGEQGGYIEGLLLDDVSDVQDGAVFKRVGHFSESYTWFDQEEVEKRDITII